MNYTAEEITQVLKSKGYNIEKRTVNYYAHDKNMIATNKGKQCFDETSLEQLEGILILREAKIYTLKQIKGIIEKYSLSEIKQKCAKEVLDYGISLISSNVAPTSVHFSNISTEDVLSRLTNMYSGLDQEKIHESKEIPIEPLIHKIHGEVEISFNEKVSEEKKELILDFIRKTL